MGTVYDFHRPCLSKSQDDIMTMCLSKSQDDDIMTMCLSKSQDDDIVDVSIEITR